MENRLNDLSSRLSSQIYDIEKKINVWLDRQYQFEHIIKDVILPSIQEMGSILVQSARNRAFQESFRQCNEKFNELKSKCQTHLTRHSLDTTANQSNKLNAITNQN